MGYSYMNPIQRPAMTAAALAKSAQAPAGKPHNDPAGTAQLCSLAGKTQVSNEQLAQHVSLINVHLAIA